jgi:hypothetical protein
LDSADANGGGLSFKASFHGSQLCAGAARVLESRRRVLLCILDIFNVSYPS